jgi:hypothetical protein
MPHYIVESYDWQLLHAGRTTDGALGEGGSSEKIYLHVIEITDAELKLLVPRVDENGNKQSDRLALPRNEAWWIAVEGEKTWPKTVLKPKLASRCRYDDKGVPQPVPVGEKELAELRKLGAKV